VQVLAYPSKSSGMFVRESLIFRSDSNGEDLEGYAGAGLYDSITTAPTLLQRVDYLSDRSGAPGSGPCRQDPSVCLSVCLCRCPPVCSRPCQSTFACLTLRAWLNPRLALVNALSDQTGFVMVRCTGGVQEHC
jgi:hypothetical protein